jgi:hypothetical protein
LLLNPALPPTIPAGTLVNYYVNREPLPSVGVLVTG